MSTGTSPVIANVTFVNRPKSCGRTALVIGAGVIGESGVVNVNIIESTRTPLVVPLTLMVQLRATLAMAVPVRVPQPK